MSAMQLMVRDRAGLGHSGELPPLARTLSGTVLEGRQLVVLRGGPRGLNCFHGTGLDSPSGSKIWRSLHVSCPRTCDLVSAKRVKMGKIVFEIPCCFNYFEGTPTPIEKVTRRTAMDWLEIGNSSPMKSRGYEWAVRGQWFVDRAHPLKRCQVGSKKVQFGVQAARGSLTVDTSASPPSCHRSAKMQ